MNESTSGIESVPLLSALKDAFGLSTVYLNQPTSYPQINWLSYSLQLLYACLPWEYLSMLAPWACLTSHYLMTTFSLFDFLYVSLWVKYDSVLAYIINMSQNAGTAIFNEFTLLIISDIPAKFFRTYSNLILNFFSFSAFYLASSIKIHTLLSLFSSMIWSFKSAEST